MKYVVIVLMFIIITIYGCSDDVYTPPRIPMTPDSANPIIVDDQMTVEIGKNKITEVGLYNDKNYTYTNLIPRILRCLNENRENITYIYTLEHDQGDLLPGENKFYEIKILHSPNLNPDRYVCFFGFVNGTSNEIYEKKAFSIEVIA